MGWMVPWLIARAIAPATTSCSGLSPEDLGTGFGATSFACGACKQRVTQRAGLVRPFGSSRLSIPGHFSLELMLFVMKITARLLR